MVAQALGFHIPAVTDAEVGADMPTDLSALLMSHAGGVFISLSGVAVAVAVSRVNGNVNTRRIALLNCVAFHGGLNFLLT